MENLKTAYARARYNGAPPYALQGHVSSQPLSGHEMESRASRYPYDGIGASAYALRKARENMENLANARARYEEIHAIRDLRRKAAAPWIAKGFSKYSITPPESGAAIADSEEASRACDTTARELANARRLCTEPGPDYGAGTWQGNDDTTPAARVPFNMPPAMRGGRHGWKTYGRHMAAGDKGGQFFTDERQGAIRNFRDAHEIAKLDHAGWFDNPNGESFRDGSGLIIGVVGQLRGRKGCAVYVPGWRQGDNGVDGAQFDLRAAVVADGREEWQAEEAAKEAARAADSMAENVAERERDYQTAYYAGQEWAELGERLTALRGEVLAALRENRLNAATAAEMPKTHAIFCEAIRGKLAERAEMMTERAELVDSCPSWNATPFRDAFCEGAAVSRFPD